MTYLELARNRLSLHMEAPCSSAQELTSPTHRSSHRFKKKEKVGKESIKDKTMCSLAAQRSQCRCHELLKEAAAGLTYV